MKQLFTSLVLLLFVFRVAGAETKPLRALLVTGGCCHDYSKQKVIIPEGVTARANVEWSVIEEGGRGTRHQNIENSIYQNPDWAKGYDIVVHNECFSEDTDAAYIERFLAPHREGLPAIVIHCTMHTFRALKTNTFREFLGVTSSRHGPQHPLKIAVLKPEHPIMKGFPLDWITGNEELYAIDEIWPNATSLAHAPDKKKDAGGQWVNTGKQNTVIWVNTFGKGRVFGTTLAHNNATMQHTNYLDMMARGVLWACGKLDTHGKPLPGYEANTKSSGIKQQ